MVIRSADEFVELRSSSERALYTRAAHESAPEEVWIAVIEQYPEYRDWVAHNKSIPESIIRILASDPDRRVRFTIAMKRATPRDILERLAHDPDDGVRARVAHNAKTPVAILQILQHDSADHVKEAAIRRLQDLEGGAG